MVVNFRSYINREIFCCFFAEQASLANTRVYNYKNEIKMALHCLSTSGVSGTKKMHILRTEFALISILPRKGKRIARFREEVYSWRDVKTGLDIIGKIQFFLENRGPEDAALSYINRLCLSFTIVLRSETRRPAQSHQPPLPSQKGRLVVMLTFDRFPVPSLWHPWPRTCICGWGDHSTRQG